ncbi:MAG TPA: NUDIX domain-containing protein [Thermoanaerobaculia bacterium]|nr:NUDIX domain-containing protein [Thermoanaerobaculia bacterium]
MTSEDVMVVATSDLGPFIAHRPANLIREGTAEILQLIAEKHFFIAREIAEASPQYRQIIPYVVIRSGEQTYVLTRTTRQSETRLHNKVSVGIGGHINPGHDLLSGLQKELEEEVDVRSEYDLEFVGILNDESTEVGRVHLGAVYELRARTAHVEIREVEKMSGRWMSDEELAAARENMESWSQIVYDQFLIGESGNA